MTNCELCFSNPAVGRHPHRLADASHQPPGTPIEFDWLCVDCLRWSQEWDAMTQRERNDYITAGDRYVQEVEDERRRQAQWSWQG